MSADVVISVLCGLAILVGMLGVVLPVLPGLLLCWAAVLVWAIFVGDGGWRWVIVGVVTALTAGAMVAKFVWPGRQLKNSGVPNLTLVAGAVLAVVGFFVIPVIGAPVGFVLGIWLAEWARMKDHRRAWPSTKEALKAAGLAMLIELGAAVAIAAVWVVGLLVA